MNTSLENLRRDAKTLRKSHLNGDKFALQRLKVHPPKADLSTLRHADYLHVIAQENQFSSWPQLKLAVEVAGMDRAQKQQTLKVALFRGQNQVVQKLLSETPDLAEGFFGLQCALYNRQAVAAKLATDPDAATRRYGPRRAMSHLAFSKYIHAVPDREADMLAIAQMLLEAGADVNDSTVGLDGPKQPLSALYGALGHANNMVLAKWLLVNGANPDDGESLYHACELGYLDGLKMLLEHGANPKGTNALARALDFEGVEAVQLLLDAGADPNEAGIPALHHAVRRMRGGDVMRVLLAAGADISARQNGVGLYAMARVFGNSAVAREVLRAGGDVSLTPDEAILAVAAEGGVQHGIYLDPAKLPKGLRYLINDLLQLNSGHTHPNRLAHIKRLVDLGLEYDHPDGLGLPPVHMAGWLGQGDLLEYFISLRPDMGYVNNYGGTLLSSIVHGSENCAAAEHVACARRALEFGVALPTWLVKSAMDEDMSALLTDWAAAHPGQVVEGGVG